METIIFGNGNLGRAIGTAVAARGWPHRVLGRPGSEGHRVADLAGTELVIDASRGDAVAGNVDVALAAGCRRFVIGTTGWEGDRASVDRRLRERSAVGLVAPNFSLGVAAFLRLVEVAGELFGRFEAFDPYVLEWHRRSKIDRPSGTARQIVDRLIAVHPAKSRPADPLASGPPAHDELEVVAVRAGASPGMHLVGFDAPGETVELRLTARDRSPYAAGALAAADWLAAGTRSPGLHDFSEVADELLGIRSLGTMPVATSAPYDTVPSPATFVARPEGVLS